MSDKRITRSLTQAIVVFVGLAIVFAVLVWVAQGNFPHNDTARVLLNSLGSAIFGAGLAFFLVEAFAIRRAGWGTVLLIFLGLTLVFLALLFVAQWLFVGNLVLYGMLVAIGASVFGGGLTFFLLELFSLR